MTVSLSLKGDVSRLTAHLRETQRSIIPSVAVQALNETARVARTEGIAEVAKQLRVTPTIVRKRFNVANEPKGERIEFFRATMGRPTASLRVWHRGIPVFHVAGATVKGKGGGIKAMGKRFYKGAFRARGLVFRRKSGERLPLFVPKISVRFTLEKAFSKRMVGTEGQRRFRQVFTKRLEARLQRMRG